MTWVGSIGFAFGAFCVGIAVKVDESPIISCGNDVFGVVSVDTVDVVSAGAWREDALDPPAEFAGVSGPFLVAELGGAARHLAEFLDVKE